MAVGTVKQLQQQTEDGVAQVRYQLQSVLYGDDKAFVTGEVVHDSPLDAATDLFVKAKFTVSGEVQETTEQIGLNNKEVIQIERTLDDVRVNEEVGFAVRVKQPGVEITDNVLFYDFVTGSLIRSADSLEPQAVEAGINRLRMNPAGATLSPGENRTLVITGVTADGTTFPVSTDATYESTNAGAVAVTAQGDLTATAPGSANITATLPSGIDSPSVTESFTVESPPEPEPPEPEPPEPEPEPVEPEPVALDFTVFDSVLQPDEQSAVSARAIFADGTDRLVSTQIGLSATDTSILNIADGDTVEAVSSGETTVTATFESEGETVTDTAAVTVNPPEVVPEQPQQPPGVNEFVIPLSFFNASPLFDGLEDVSFTVPQISGITEAVAENTADLTDIEDTVDSAVDSIDIPEPPSLSDIGGEVDTALTEAGLPSLSDISGSVDTRVLTLETKLGLPSLPDDEDIVSLLDSAESGVSDVTTAVDTTVSDTIDTADNAFESVQGNLQAELSTVQTALQEDVTAAQTTLDQIQGTAAEFEGVTLPGLQDSVDSITGDLLGEVADIPTAIDNRVTPLEESLGLTEDTELAFPTVDEFVSSVQDELIPTVTAADGTEVGLLDATPRFISIALEDFLQEALSEDTKRQIGNSVAEER
jgi:hypothetical protein